MGHETGETREPVEHEVRRALKHIGHEARKE